MRHICSKHSTISQKRLLDTDTSTLTKLPAKSDLKHIKQGTWNTFASGSVNVNKNAGSVRESSTVRHQALWKQRKHSHRYSTFTQPSEMTCNKIKACLRVALTKLEFGHDQMVSSSGLSKTCRTHTNRKRLYFSAVWIISHTRWRDRLLQCRNAPRKLKGLVKVIAWGGWVSCRKKQGY